MFSKAPKNSLPPRLWLLEGEPTSGKSTFASQMRAPLLPIDADHRFAEVYKWVTGEVYELSNDPSTHHDAQVISKLLEENMRGSGTGTIVIDSLTAILTPFVVDAMMDNRAGRNKNQVAAYADKALVLRRLQDGVTKWGCDVLWVTHLADSRDNNAKSVQRSTLTATEYKRLQRSLNGHLRVVTEGKRRGILIHWSRTGVSGQTLWDDSDHWVGMPDKIEEALYKTTYNFPSMIRAISWSVERGTFKTVEEAEVVYTELRNKEKPTTADQMWQAWGELVAARKGKQS